MKHIIKNKIAISAAMVAACSILFSFSSANAMDERTELRLGAIEYLSNCASCHGAEAKGDGPVASSLVKKPSDLTIITKEFSGIFPEEHIYSVIDGRKRVNPHGDTDMPVWGDRYDAMTRKASEKIAHPLREQEAQELAFGRISWLVAYIESIQIE